MDKSSDASIQYILDQLRILSREISKTRLFETREILTGNRTYYVSTSGADTNNGRDASTPFLTIQRAATVASKLDLNGYAVTIQLANGTYTVSSSIVLYDLVGNGSVTILGDATTPSNVVVQWTTSGGNLFVNQSSQGRWYLRGLRLTATGGGSPTAIYALERSIIHFRDIEFNTGWNVHAYANLGATIWVNGNYAILSGCAYHLYVQIGGRIYCAGITVTLTGTPAWTGAFIGCTDSSVAYLGSNTYSGAATGSRYTITLNSVVNTGGGGATYLPGNAVGTTATGGQYA